MELNEIPRRDGRTFALVHERLPWAETLNAFGDFDLSVANELQEAIDVQLQSRLPLVVDLSFCEYLDSTILRVLVRSYCSAPDRIGIVVPENARIGRIFEMTRLMGALKVARSREVLRERVVPV